MLVISFLIPFSVSFLISFLIPFSVSFLISFLISRVVQCRWGGVSNSAKHLLSQMLQADPSRCVTRSVYKHTV